MHTRNTYLASLVLGALLLLAPLIASAQMSIPQIPENPTVKDLQYIVLVLTSILQQLLQAQPAYAQKCFVYERPVCTNGIIIQSRGIDGCYGTPLCVPYAFATLPQ